MRDCLSRPVAWIRSIFKPGATSIALAVFLLLLLLYGALYLYTSNSPNTLSNIEVEIRFVLELLGALLVLYLFWHIASSASARIDKNSWIKRLATQLGGEGSTSGIKVLRIIFTTCFIAGIFLRLYALDQIPGMHTDEAGYGLWARDIHLGTYYPLAEETVAKSGPLFMYLISFAYKLFGVNLYSVRFVVAFFGILSILTTYLLAKNLFNEKVALCSASLMSVSGFFVTYSRLGFDVDLLPFFLTCSLLFLVLSRRKRETLYLSLAGLLLGLSLHLHPTAFIGIPIVLCLIWVLYGKSIFRKPGLYLGLALMLLAISPILVYNMQNDFPALHSMTAETSIQHYNFSILVKDMAVSFHELGDSLSEKALNYWEWGGWQTGHQLKFMWPIDFALLIIGLVFTTITHKERELFLIFWLLASLGVLVMFTSGGYGWGIDLRLFPERLNVVFPALVILVGFALAKIDDLASRSRILKTIFLLLFISILSYHSGTIVHDYFGWYQETGGAGRYTMQKEQVSEYIVDNLPKSTVLVSDNFILFGPRSLKFLTGGDYLVLTPPPEAIFFTAGYAKFIDDINTRYANRDRAFIFVANRAGEREIGPFFRTAYFESIYPSLEPCQVIPRSNGEPAFYIYLLKGNPDAVVYYKTQSEVHLVSRLQHLVVTTTGITNYTPDDYDDKEGYTWRNSEQVWYKNYINKKQGDTILRFDNVIDLNDIIMLRSSKRLEKIEIPLNQNRGVTIVTIVVTPSGVRLEEGAIQKLGKALFVGKEEMIATALANSGFNVEISSTIPSDMSAYSLVVVSDYNAGYKTTADYLRNYIYNGGGVILIGGTPCMFPYDYQPHSTSEGFNDISYISEWFGASFYGNVGTSNATARISVNNPFGIELMRNSEVYYSSIPSEAAVGNLSLDGTQVIANWDHSDGNLIFAFTHTYGAGQLYYQAAVGGIHSEDNLNLLVRAAKLIADTDK